MRRRRPSPLLSESASLPLVPPERLRASPEAYQPVDVRSRAGYLSGRVPGALHVPWDLIGEHLEPMRARPGRTLVLYCEHGGRARRAADHLRSMGIGPLALLNGHMARWRGLGLPFERDGA